MALALVPVLLSLLASLPQASPSGADLVVRVVDKNGQPVAGVQVGLCPVWPGHSSTFGIGLSDANGNARIENALDTVRRDTGHAFFVRLGMPADPDVRVSLDREHLDDTHPTLVVPDHGRVVLKLPAMADESCHARLRCTPRTPAEQSAIWSGSSLPQIRCEKGVATCEFVGLGLDLEYEVLGEVLPRPLQGTFRGPSKSGETVEIDVPGFESCPTLLVTLLDADRMPLRDMPCDWSLGTGRGAHASRSGGYVHSDKNGRALIPLEAAQAQAGERQLSIQVRNREETSVALLSVFPALTLPADFTRGECELGECVLAPFGSPKRFELLDDAALRREFEESSAPVTVRIDSGFGSTIEEMLCEMIRRGGPAWERYIAERLAARRIDRDEAHGFGPGGLELLTTLRRLQHKPDPLLLDLGMASVTDTMFPHSPWVQFSWKNVDAEGESFELTQGGSYRSGRFARCNVEAIGPNGERLPPREWSRSIGGGLQSSERLGPGEEWPGALDLGDFVSFVEPGEYRVRIHYHDKEDIASISDLRGWIVSSSAEFRVQVLPRTISISHARLEETRSWIRALDTSKRIPLVSGHFHDELTFTGTPLTPEDSLFRSGWDALPALFDALQDSTIDRPRRAWVLGMLWNITGVQNPLLCGSGAGLGKFEWVHKWPSSTEDAHPTMAESCNPSDAPVWEADQDVLTSRWSRWRSLVEVKIVP